MHPKEEKAFLDAMSPENILGGALRNVFRESDSVRELTQLLELLESHARAKRTAPQARSTRATISLNEAIMLGKITASKDALEYETFEVIPEAQERFTISYPDLSSHIYAWAQQIEATNYTQTTDYAELKSKINNPTIILTEQELLQFQKPRFLAFLGYIDISIRRQRAIDEIRSNENFSLIQQNEKSALVERYAIQITSNRAQYLAALASRNPEAIYFHSLQPLRLEQSQTLLQEIQQLRSTSSETHS